MQKHVLAPLPIIYLFEMMLVEPEVFVFHSAAANGTCEYIAKFEKCK